ncbi:MAG: radical SAM protein [Rhodospirillales bacterium]
MRSVLLVDPGTDFAEGGTRHATRQTPHIGLCYLAMVLRKHAHVTMLDMPLLGLSVDDLRRELEKLKAGDLVGITTATFNVPEAIEAAELAKEVNPELKVILGGPHVNAYPKDVLERSASVDAAIVGEAEFILSEIVANLDNANFDIDLPGVVHRAPEGITFRPVSPAFVVSNMDDLPFLDWNFLQLGKYWKRYSVRFDSMVQMAPLSTNRGCPYKCSFCDGANLTSKLRWRSAKHTVDEIEHALNTYGLRHYYITDSVMCIPKPRFREFCDMMIERGLHKEVSFIGQAQINSIDEDMVEAFARAGGEYIFFGLESGNEEVLAKNGKPITKDKIRRVVDTAYNSGLHPRGSFILGLPFETEASALDTIEFSHELKLHTANFFILDFYPGTRAKRMLEQGEGGLVELDGGIDWDTYIPSRGHAHVSVNDLSPGRLEELLQYAKSLPMPFQDSDLMFRQKLTEFIYLAERGNLIGERLENWLTDIENAMEMASAQQIATCKPRLQRAREIAEQHRQAQRLAVFESSGAVKSI